MIYNHLFFVFSVVNMDFSIVFNNKNLRVNNISFPITG